MLLFVGLGNPTPDSENNRHNIGFKIIDALNKKFSLSKQKPKFKGLLTTGNIESEKIPESITIDLDGVDIGESFKISSVTLETDVVPTIQGRDFVIATLAAPTVMKEPEKPAEAEAAAGEEGAEGAEGAAAADGDKPAPDGAKADKKEGDDKKSAEKKPSEEKK